MSISLEKSVRTCSVNTGEANRIQSDRFFNPQNMVCIPWNGLNNKGQEVSPTRSTPRMQDVTAPRIEYLLKMLRDPNTSTMSLLALKESMATFMVALPATISVTLWAVTHLTSLVTICPVTLASNGVLTLPFRVALLALMNVIKL